MRNSKPVLQGLMDTLYARMMKDVSIQKKAERKAGESEEGRLAPCFQKMQDIKRGVVWEPGKKRKESRRVRRGAEPQRSRSCTGRIQDDLHPWHDADMDAGRDSFSVIPLHYSQFLSNTMTTFSSPNASAYTTRQDRGSLRLPAAKRLPRNSSSFFPQIVAVPTKRQCGRPKPFQEMSQRELHEAFLLPASQRNLVMHATEDELPMSKAESKALINHKLQQQEMQRAGRTMYQPRQTSTPRPTVTSSVEYTQVDVQIPVGGVNRR